MANKQNKLHGRIVRYANRYGYQDIDVLINYDRTNKCLETIFIKYQNNILYKCLYNDIDLRRLQQFCIYKLYVGYDDTL